MPSHTDRHEPISIRPASSEDADHIARLLDVLGYPADPATVPSRLARLNSFPTSLALVAHTSHSIVGVVTAMLSPSIHDDAPVAWLTTLVIASEMQGRGIGRQLVRAVEDWAREGGAVRISVTSASRREDAHRFYEGLGYAKTGVRLGRPLIA